MKNSEFPGLTIKDLISSLKYSDDLFEWLYWPPNVFALTSMILQRTGSYRICLIEDIDWDYAHRNKIIGKEADHWIREVGKVLRDGSKEFQPFNIRKRPGNTIFKEAFEIIQQNLDFELIHLRIIVSDPIDKFPKTYIETAEKAREIAKALVNLHAISDLACSTMGIVDSIYSNDADLNLAITIGNFLLTSTGSLSTIDKLNGVVLPKYRTPQQGQVLRSLSHHLTFHVTETEIIWRTIPWLNTNEKTLNILAIPMPYSVRAHDFETIPEKNHPSRYFKLKIKDFDEERINLLHSIVDKLIELKGRISRIHIVVLPELSITKNEYDYLLKLIFLNQKEIHHLPIIVAGVLSEDFDDVSGFEVYNNEVKIANYFAGRWYDISQRKHHRWRIDKNQLIQYQLATKMTTQRNWFEYTSSSQRRLTVLSANSWLSLVALICEDLARLEPVSEVIRGIGPTLLMALLSDGPQISNRWSARYATVLADDPGTSVLSLTSLGMAKRSKMSSLESPTYTNSPNHVVALWKDSKNGNKEIAIPDENDQFRKGFLLTITAKFKEEFTIDGRSDNCCASEFEIDTCFPVTLWAKKNINNHSQTQPEDLQSSVNWNNFRETSLGELGKFTEKLGTWNDIREVSLLYYALDNIVTTKDANLELLCSWLNLTLDKGPDNKYSRLYYLFSKALTEPLEAGLGIKDVIEWPSSDIVTCIELIKTIINTAVEKVKNKKSDLVYYEELFKVTEEIFFQNLTIYDTWYTDNENHTEDATDTKANNNSQPNDLDNQRIKLAVCITICIIINSKINDWQNPKFNNENEKKTIAGRVQKLRGSVEKFIHDNYNKFSLYPNLNDETLAKK